MGERTRAEKAEQHIAALSSSITLDDLQNPDFSVQDLLARVGGPLLQQPSPGKPAGSKQLGQLPLSATKQLLERYERWAKAAAPPAAPPL